MVFFSEEIKRFAGAVVLASVIAVFPCSAGAETATSEFALFKRTISPVWQWGENGILTVPKAAPIGKYNIYVAGAGQEAGEIQGEKLYNSNASLVIGTSDDAEIGYTRRQLIWANGDRTDLESDVFHIKARVLNLADNFLPQLSVGVIGTSLRDNQYTSTKDVLFNPFVVATINVPLFSDSHRVSFTGMAESLYSSNESTETFFNAGVDIALFNNMLILAAEYQGIGKKDLDPVVNAGGKLKLLNVLSIGAGKFNMRKSALEKSATVDKTTSGDNSYTMFFVSLELPLGKK